MIDLASAYEVRDALDNKVIDSIIDEFGNIWYEAFKKLIASGVPPITLQKCKGVDLVDYKIYGNSVQDGTPNDFDKNTYPDESFFLSNVDTIGQSGTLSVSLSVIKSFTLQLEKNTGYKITKTAGQIFRAIGCNEKPVSGGVGVLLAINNTGKTITFNTEDYNYIVVDYWRNSDVISSKEMIQSIVIEKIPTPDNPVEIQSVGDKTANLYAGQSEYTLTKVTNDTHISFYEAFEIGKTYTLFCYIDNTQGTATSGFRMSVGKVTDGVNSWNYLSSNRINVGSEGYARALIPIPDNYNGQLNMQYQVNGGTATFKDIMLVEGSYNVNNLPAYEPYGYKIPVKVSGKNKIPTNEFVSSNIWGVSIINMHLLIKYIKPGKTYRISADFICDSAPDVTTSNTLGFQLLKKNATENIAMTTIHRMTVGETYHISKYFTLPEDTTETSYMGIFAYMNYSSSAKKGCGGRIENIQIEEGTIETPFEPHVNPITTNIYLDEPLRKIGDYKDYIDFANSNVIRQVGHIEFDGTEDFWSNQKVTTQQVCSILKTNIGTNSTIIPALSELIRSNYFNLSTTLNVVELGQLYSGVSYINFNLDGTNDLTTFKNWLSTQYSNGTPVNLEFPLAEETEETITLPTIPTHKGTNIIEVDTTILPSNMEVKYYGKEQ